MDDSMTPRVIVWPLWKRAWGGLFEKGVFALAQFCVESGFEGKGIFPWTAWGEYHLGL